MEKHLMTCKQWDIAVIPFPFVESPKTKPRPVLVLSNTCFIDKNGHFVAAMITSAMHTAWHGDTPITGLSEAGLKKKSIIRFKLFTLDMRFQPRIIGSLNKKDRGAVLKTFTDVLISSTKGF